MICIIFLTVEIDLIKNKNYKEAVENTRKIVKLFKKSPLKTASLEKYAKEEFG